MEVYGANGEHKSAVCQTYNPRETLKGIHFYQAFIKVVSLYLPLSNISLQQSSCNASILCFPFTDDTLMELNWRSFGVAFRGLWGCCCFASPIHLYSRGLWQKGSSKLTEQTFWTPALRYGLLCVVDRIQVFSFIYLHQKEDSSKQYLS